jgi:hypothetical protein
MGIKWTRVVSVTAAGLCGCAAVASQSYVADVGLRAANYTED